MDDDSAGEGPSSPLPMPKVCHHFMFLTFSQTARQRRGKRAAKVLKEVRLIYDTRQAVLVLTPQQRPELEVNVPSRQSSAAPRTPGRASARASSRTPACGTRVDSNPYRAHQQPQRRRTPVDDDDAATSMELARATHGRVALQGLYEDLALVVHVAFDAVEFGLYVIDAFPDRQRRNKHAFIWDNLMYAADYCGRSDIVERIESNPRWTRQLAALVRLC